MYWSGDYSSQQRRTPLFILDQITMTIWTYTRNTNFEELKNLFDFPKRLILEREAEILNVSTINWKVSPMDEIYTSARSSNQVDESKSFRPLRHGLMLGEDARSFRSKPKMAYSTRIIWTVQFLHRILWNRRRTDWVRVEYFQDLTSLAIFQMIPKDLQDQKKLNLDILKVELFSCQCSMTLIGRRQQIQKSAFRILNTWRITRRGSREHTGQSEATETKRSGTELSTKHLKEKGIPSVQKWWNATEKLDIRYSRVSVPWTVEFWEGKLWEMGFVLIRHSAVELRRVNMVRGP